MSTDIISSNLTYSQPPSDGSQPYLEYKPGLKAEDWPTNLSREAQEVAIENVRGHEHEYNLDTAGFLFKKHVSGFKNFDSQEAIKKDYYKECADLIKQVTGANRVVAFEHHMRTNVPRAPGATVPDETLDPALYVHLDHSPAAAVELVHKYIPENMAASLLQHRFQIITLWRPIKRPALDHPFALCDFRSIDHDNDITHVNVIIKEQGVEGSTMKYNPQHKWKYQRGMTPDEIVFFKGCDTIVDGKTARFAPHAAFIDPTTPRDAPPRESIEVRGLVFYDHLPVDVDG